MEEKIEKLIDRAAVSPYEIELTSATVSYPQTHALFRPQTTTTRLELISALESEIVRFLSINDIGTLASQAFFSKQRGISFILAFGYTTTIFSVGLASPSIIETTFGLSHGAVPPQIGWVAGSISGITYSIFMQNTINTTISAFRNGGWYGLLRADPIKHFQGSPTYEISTGIFSTAFALLGAVPFTQMALQYVTPIHPAAGIAAAVGTFIGTSISIRYPLGKMMGCLVPNREPSDLKVVLSRAEVRLERLKREIRMMDGQDLFEYLKGSETQEAFLHRLLRLPCQITSSRNKVVDGVSNIVISAGSRVVFFILGRDIFENLLGLSTGWAYAGSGLATIALFALAIDTNRNNFPFLLDGISREDLNAYKLPIRLALIAFGLLAATGGLWMPLQWLKSVGGTEGVALKIFLAGASYFVNAGQALTGAAQIRIPSIPATCMLSQSQNERFKARILELLNKFGINLHHMVRQPELHNALRELVAIMEGNVPPRSSREMEEVSSSQVVRASVTISTTDSNSSNLQIDEKDQPIDRLFHDYGQQNRIHISNNNIAQDGFIQIVLQGISNWTFVKDSEKKQAMQCIKNYLTTHDSGLLTKNQVENMIKSIRFKVNQAIYAKSWFQYISPHNWSCGSDSRFTHGVYLSSWTHSDALTINNLEQSVRDLLAFGISSSGAPADLIHIVL